MILLIVSTHVFSEIMGFHLQIDRKKIVIIKNPQFSVPDVIKTIHINAKMQALFF